MKRLVSFKPLLSNKQTNCNDEAQMTNERFPAVVLSVRFRHCFVVRHSSFVICLALATSSVFADPPPSAKDILASVRMIESKQQLDLHGQLRQNDIVIPFQLVQNGPVIRY